MAENISDYLETNLLDHALNTAAYTQPTIYVALIINPNTVSDVDTGTTIGAKEPSGGSYARTLAGAFAAASSPGGDTANSSDITFPTATGDWGTIDYIVLVDAATLGNALWWGPLTTPRAVLNNDTFKILAGDLQITLG